MQRQHKAGIGEQGIPVPIAHVVAQTRQVIPDDTILCLDNGLYKVCILLSPRCCLAAQQSDIVTKSHIADC